MPAKTPKSSHKLGYPGTQWGFFLLNKLLRVREEGYRIEFVGTVIPTRRKILKVEGKIDISPNDVQELKNKVLGILRVYSISCVVWPGDHCTNHRPRRKLFREWGRSSYLRDSTQ